MIIDSHCHVYPDKIAKKASDSTGGFYSLDMSYDGTVSAMLEAGDKAGIDKYIIQSVATTPAQVRKINSFIAETVEIHKGRMFGLGTLHPESKDLQGDVENIIELGLNGVKLHPDIQNFRLDYYKALKIYELCEKYSLPVLIHAGDRRYDNSNPNRISPIADIYDNLTIIAAHFGGYSVWEEAVQVLSGKNNLFVDTSSSLFALDDDTVMRYIEMYGVDRVLFGTDYPMWEPSTEVERIKSLPLSDEDREKIFYKNAVKVFGLEI